MDKLLESVRFFKNRGKHVSDTIKECMYQQGLFEEALCEEDMTEETQDVLAKIENGDFKVDDFDSFCAELTHNKRSAYLTPYTPDELRDAGAHTYQVNGYEIGFALKPYPNGGADIVGVHNNTPIHGVGKSLIQAAIKNGGTTLDHFDGYLSDFYGGLGFKEYDRWTWDDQYAPKDWDYENNGRPDVVLRSLSGERPVD